MELSCDSLLNRYLVVALQNSVFGSEFMSISRAVSADVCLQFVDRYYLLLNVYFCSLVVIIHSGSKKLYRFMFLR